MFNISYLVFLLKITNSKNESFSKLLVGYLGLEPRTIRLKAEYSTIELATLIKIIP